MPTTLDAEEMDTPFKGREAMQVSATHETVSNFGSPHARRCGSKTRCGAPCRNLAVRGMKRCRMHGGKSLAGIAHPNYKHGWYAADIFHQLKREMVRDYRRREKFRREVAALLERERLAREAADTAHEQQRKRHKWKAEALRRLSK